jgi:hypothetical protein
MFGSEFHACAESGASRRAGPFALLEPTKPCAKRKAQPTLLAIGLKRKVSLSIQNDPFLLLLCSDSN